MDGANGGNSKTTEGKNTQIAKLLSTLDPQSITLRVFCICLKGRERGLIPFTYIVLLPLEKKS